MKVARAFSLFYDSITSVSPIPMPVVKQEDIARTDEMPTSKGGSAVGVPSRKWFVPIVKTTLNLLAKKCGDDTFFTTWVDFLGAKVKFSE